MDLSLCKRNTPFSHHFWNMCVLGGFFSELDSFSQALLLLGTLESFVSHCNNVLCWFHNWPEAIKQSYSLGMLLTVVWKGEKKNLARSN